MKKEHFERILKFYKVQTHIDYNSTKLSTFNFNKLKFVIGI